MFKSNNVFLLHVSNLDAIYCFIEQKSLAEVRQSLLKMAKKYDIAWRHGAAISDAFYVYLEKDPNANF
jgi:Ni,Fe-hydrogenase I cytochrome b subunit